jgi:hypothetical protein
MHWLSLLLISLVLCSAQAASLAAPPLRPPLTNGPQSQCAFPTLCPSCRMNSATIRIAQRLLAAAFNAAELVPDGVFTPGFAANITLFQEKMSLPATGKLDQGTWQALVASTSPVSPSSQINAISALQDALSSLGFPVTIDGAWGNSTTAAFASFRSTRSLPPPSPLPATTPTDWLLLTSWCVPSAGSFWFDAGWPQGVLDVVTLSCLRNSGFEFATFECWRGREGPGQVQHDAHATFACLKLLKRRTVRN